ncbi:MAG: hypothetical protein Q4P72_01450 [Eubacteriales bacterium]|nr:hypothetical protein [Eubacteriales bacterium]
MPNAKTEYGEFSLKSKFRNLLTGFLTGLVALNLFTNPATVFAAEQNAPSKTENISAEELKNIENELRFIFEEARPWENGKLSINESLLKQKYGDEHGT